MSSREPVTRHISLAELRKHLTRTQVDDAATRVYRDVHKGRRKEVEGDGPTRTRLTSNAVVGAPSLKKKLDSKLAHTPDLIGAAHASSARSQGLLASTSQPSNLASIAQDTVVVPRSRGGARFPRAVFVRLGLAALAVLVVYGLLRSRDDGSDKEEVRAGGQVTVPPRMESPREQPPAGPLQAEKEVTAGAPPAEVRAAVNFLLAGETRRALDAYRGLARTGKAEFVLAARLLERELAECVRAGEGGTCSR